MEKRFSIIVIVLWRGIPYKLGMRYPSDLTDTEWACISYCFPKTKPGRRGRPRQHAYRELLNGIFYLNKTGCQWRNLPTHFAPWRTVYHYFRRWKINGLWVAIHTHLRAWLRRGQEGQRAQAAYPGGYVGTPPAGQGVARQPPGSGRCQATARGQLCPEPASPDQTYLGRRRLPRNLAGLEPQTRALHDRNSEAYGTAYVQGVAPPLGRGAHVWLAGPLPPPQPRLRTPSPDRETLVYLAMIRLMRARVGRL